MSRRRLGWITIALMPAAVLCAWAVWAQSQTPIDRSALRASYTAPPVIPHEVGDERDTASCIMCHQGVVQLGDRVTVATPHPQFRNCTQCHVRSVLPDWMKPRQVESGWQGLAEPTTGVRAHELAPPTIPHRLFFRENCSTCHAKDHPNAAMRSPHSERWSCRQCHLANPANEFRLAPR